MNIVMSINLKQCKNDIFAKLKENVSSIIQLKYDLVIFSINNFNNLYILIIK